MLLIPLFMIVFKIHLLESVVATACISAAFLPIDLIVYKKYYMGEPIGHINELMYSGVRFEYDFPVYYRETLPSKCYSTNKFFMVPARDQDMNEIDTLWCYGIGDSIQFMGITNVFHPVQCDKIRSIRIWTNRPVEKIYYKIRIGNWAHIDEDQGLWIRFNQDEGGYHYQPRSKPVPECAVTVKSLMDRQKTEKCIDLALLTPAAFWIAMDRNLDIVSGASKARTGIYAGYDIYEVHKHLGEFSPDWELLHTKLNNEENSAWLDRVKVWETILNNQYQALYKLFKTRDYAAMIRTVDSALKNTTATQSTEFVKLVNMVDKQMKSSKQKVKPNPEYERIRMQYEDVCSRLAHPEKLSSIDRYRLDQTKRALVNMMRQMVALGKDRIKMYIIY